MFFFKIKWALILIVTVLSINALADGLLMPKDTDYPKDFLRNRKTQVTVNIHGPVAETWVYQEFVNEWNQATDAVYSFPLPPDARATEFLYWRNDTTFKAILKVKEQAVNPGTGEGGVAALVNDYIGRNGIKIELLNIPPGKIQKVELRYISLCDYYQGRYDYTFPLDTGDFIKHPLDHLEFNINIESNSDIIDFKSPSHPDVQVLNSSPENVQLKWVYPKTYIDQDFDFWFKTDNTEPGVDFYSVANDSMDGHYVLFVRPQDQAPPDSVLPKRVIFLLSNSNGMSGYKLEQSITAMCTCLDMLAPTDIFNILLFNYRISSWQSSPVMASSDNINQAKVFLSNINTSSGSRLDLGLTSALEYITDETYNNSIIAFTDGYSPIDPREIESLNIHKAGIFPIGIGDKVSRERLEMTAHLNYGFVTYFDQNDNLIGGITRVFKKISQPILQDVVFEYGRVDLYDIMPTKVPTIYAGSYFFTTGRYKNPQTSAFAMGGKSVTGQTAYDFQLDFTSETWPNKCAEYLWAKEKIDALEREIEIYGETEELKNELIDLSLLYNIRCRYTAYIADYETIWVPTTVEGQIENTVSIPNSYILGNYPNPFNPATNIKIYISPDMAGSTTKLIKIFNSLGQLVAVFDISHLQSGFHTIQFDGKDFFGNSLPTGLYFVHLQVGEQISTLRITLLK